jgi:hypothetical protein
MELIQKLQHIRKKNQYDKAWHWNLQENQTFMAYAGNITSLTGLCDPIGPAPDFAYTGICPNNTLPLGDLQEVSYSPHLSNTPSFTIYAHEIKPVVWRSLCVCQKSCISQL